MKDSPGPEVFLRGRYKNFIEKAVLFSLDFLSAVLFVNTNTIPAFKSGNPNPFKSFVSQQRKCYSLARPIILKLKNIRKFI